MANNAYISRKVPFYLLGLDEINDSNGFDAYPVEVPIDAVAKCQKLRATVSSMENSFFENSAPEEAAQEEADLLVALLDTI